MKKLHFDFETAGKIPEKASPIQFAYVLEDTETGHTISRSFFVKFEKQFENCTDDEKGGLVFNGIKNNIDLQEHNLKAKTSVEVIKIFKKHLKDFERVDILSGFNISYFDMPVLDIFFKKHTGVKFSELFVYGVCDVFLKALEFAKNELLELPNGKVIKAVCFYKSSAFRTFMLEGSNMTEVAHFLKLENLHPLIFGETGLKFHKNALDDVMASMQVSNYLDRLILKYPEFAYEFQESLCRVCGDWIDLNSSNINDKTICNKNSCLVFGFNELQDDYFKLRVKNGLSVPKDFKTSQ